MDSYYFLNIGFYYKSCLRRFGEIQNILAGGSTVSFFSNIDFKRIRPGNTQRCRGQVARRTADKSRRTTSDRHADQILSAIYYQYEADGRYVDKGPLSGHGLLLGKANRASPLPGAGPITVIIRTCFPFCRPGRTHWPN